MSLPGFAWARVGVDTEARYRQGGDPTGGSAPCREGYSGLGSLPMNCGSNTLSMIQTMPLLARTAWQLTFDWLICGPFSP